MHTRQVLIAVCYLFIVNSSAANECNNGIEQLRKNIELSQETENKNKIDPKTAKEILAHFIAPRDRWERFLDKIRSGNKGTIVTTLQIIEYSSDGIQKELQFALQETLITLPEVLLDASVKANASLDWICGKPAYNNYDISSYLNEERLASLESFLEVIYPKNSKDKCWHENNLKHVAKRCLEQIQQEIKGGDNQ